MIEFKNINKEYNNKKVVNDLDLTIYSDDFFVLVGPSGSGKSTILKMINGLVKPTSGQVLIDGVDNQKTDLLKLRHDIGYVLQNIALYPHLSVNNNIMLLLELHNYAKENRQKRIDELLAFVDLDKEEFANKMPRQLSGGQAQRVGIIRALASKPYLILMDEPFSALDPLSKKQLQDLVLNIYQETGVTIVFVTHDMEEALKLGTRIGVMKEGNLIEVGTSEQIRNSNNEFTKSFFAKTTDYSFNINDVLKADDQVKRETVNKNTNQKELIQLVKTYDQVNIEEAGKIIGYIDKDSILDSLIQGDSE